MREQQRPKLIGMFISFTLLWNLLQAVQYILYTGKNRVINSAWKPRRWSSSSRGAGESWRVESRGFSSFKPLWTRTGPEDLCRSASTTSMVRRPSWRCTFWECIGRQHGSVVRQLLCGRQKSSVETHKRSPEDRGPPTALLGWHLSRARKIIKDNSKPGQHLFNLLPDGRRSRCTQSQTDTFYVLCYLVLLRPQLCAIGNH